ncbi:galanin receptor 2a-like [Hydractinia symbiolongicarpus]|uniref:galanin receptor 2a-like n=1 Tax=Hydractinia symbiolongicarpus TaxID=13093 RepID=UPI0025513CD4|nr:galanin receptor 2a-like [Hydractinia symbiolongicarpus]
MTNTSAVQQLHKSTTCRLDNYSIIYMSIYCFIIATGIIGNSTVLYIFRPYTKRARKSYEVLIWYLSLFDVISCVIAINEVYENLTCHEDWPFGWFGCKTIYSCYYISINISICILLIITLDRYRCIVTPFRKKLTPTFIHTSVFVSIIISFALQWYQFKALHIKPHGVYNHERCVQNKGVYTYTVPRVATLLFRDLIYITVFSTTTLTVYRSFQRRKRRSLTYQKCDKNKGQNKNIFFMLFIMGCTFAVLVLPYDIWDCAMLISRMLPQSHHINMTTGLQHMDTALSMLQMCNSVSNCFIYAKMHRHFKSQIVKHFYKEAEKNPQLLTQPSVGNRNSQNTEIESCFY